MTALPANPSNSTSVSRTIAGLSPGLKSLLSVEPSNHRAVSEIARNPVLLDECRRALPAILANATMPAGAEGVTKVIASLFVMFPQPHRAEPEWEEFWASYHTVLRNQPLTALEAAKEAILRDPKVEFLPKPARVLELSKTTPNRAVKAYDRAKAAAEYQPPRAPHPADSDPKYIDPSVRALLQPQTGRVEPSEADKARVRRQLAEYQAKDDARKATAKSLGADLPSTAGRPDATGITPALRALLERQAQA